MSTAPVSARTQSSSYPDAARRLIDGLCNFDVDEVTSALNDDVRLSLSGAPHAQGRSRVRAALIRALGWTCFLG